MDLIDKHGNKIVRYGENSFTPAQINNALSSLNVKSKLVVEKLQQVTSELSKRSKREWRDAHQVAIDVENPQRFQLHAIYRDTLLDLHVQAVMMQRFLKFVKRPIVLVDDDGKLDKEATKLIEKKWFYQFLKHAWEAKAWGHSLIQFHDIVEGEFKKVSIVNRDHVVPEKGIVVKQPGDESGFDYRNGPLSEWTIEVGEEKDLGFLLEVSLASLSTKYMGIFWDEFAEIFGIPMRIGRTTSNNTKERNMAAQMLEQMGSAAWGLFDQNTDIEIKEAATNDAFKVFDQRIIRNDKQISKRVVGQTMTTDDGSSRSQGEVHLDILEDIIEADQLDMKFVLNDELLPFLIKHGYPIEGLKFDYNDEKELTPEERLERDKWLVDYFDIDIEYFQEHYNGQITGFKKTAPGGGQPSDTGK